MNQQTILILPGWQGSGDKHWQGIWLKKYPNAVKVEQRDWINAVKDEWVSVLNNHIEEYKDNDIILVGHSLACPTIAHWADQYFDESRPHIKGALLVCPSDTEVSDFPAEMQGFAPIPLKPLGFRTIVVASADDPWVNIDCAEYFANSWGAEFVNIGPHGHINTDAGFGEWDEGEILLEELME